ncbi:hypothetical protein AWB73_00098 [Caballeronia turbans]|nr:hypothetical protein AWB73_00098 [Caballeronia turbans]
MSKSEPRADVWMPLYIGDYLADTSRLTTEQHGAYLLLIMDYWRNGAPPDDDEVLRNITRFSKFLWKKNRAILENFFAVKDGRWTHSRIDEEIAKALSSKAAAVEKASNAAKARWEKKDAPSMSQAVLEQCPSPSPSPTPLKTKSKADERASRLPADWQPSDDDVLFCREQRPDLHPAHVASQFRDYWIAQPGAKGRKVDWPATWRNWVRNQRAANSPRQIRSYHDERAETIAALTGRNRGYEQDDRTIELSTFRLASVAG